MDSSTNIHALPSPPTENVVMNVQQQQPPPLQSSIDQDTMQQILSGLQDASSGGYTQLPSRDIPQNTTDHVIDRQVQPNYIPTPEHPQSYVEDDTCPTEEPTTLFKNMDERIYHEIQGPLMFALLYFIFQLPIVKKTLFLYLPFLFMNDGNINLYGYVLTSALFGIICFIMAKAVNSLK